MVTYRTSAELLPGDSVINAAVFVIAIHFIYSGNSSSTRWKHNCDFYQRASRRDPVGSSRESVKTLEFLCAEEIRPCPP